jgi:hypothetical protein
MSKYIIKAEAGEDCNPEFAPDREMEEGIGCDGFMIVAFSDGKPKFETMMGFSVADLSNWIRRGSKGGQIVRKGWAIAEGQIRALEISEEGKEGTTIGRDDFELNKVLTQEELARILGGIRNGRRFE